MAEILQFPRGSLHDVIIGAPWGYDNGFRILEEKPSQVVQKAIAKGIIHSGNRILDLGCGKNPRNAIYLSANLGCFVDGVDLEQVEIPTGTTKKAVGLLRFHQSSVLDFQYQTEAYQIAILARLIQYLPEKDLRLLLSKVYQSLLPNGFALISYTAQGGILTKGADYDVNTFAYPIKKVKKLLKDSGFRTVEIDDGAPISTHVPYAGTFAKTYDIISQRIDTFKTGALELKGF